MMKINRSHAPQILADNWEKWGRIYQTSGTDFNWKVDKINVREEILPLLREMTNDHCSYCDGFPMESMLGETIDHFKPKSLFPFEAYCWENLFLCCYICQKRINQFQEILLKPDEIEYEFSDYFFYNTENGEIEPNKKANSQNRERAKYTIRIFKLNKFNRPKARKLFFRKFAKDLNPIIEEYPFRFMFL